MSDRVLAALAGFYNHTLEDVLELFRERAGIRENQPGMSLEDVEREALNDVRRMLALERLAPRAAASDTADTSSDTKLVR